MLSTHWEEQLGKAQFKGMMRKYGDDILASDTKESQMVHRVLDRLIPFSGLPEESWEVRVIDEPETNAWVLPGGKVFIYTGMIDLCANDDGLAVVLGHEMGHIIAHHGVERVSRALALVPIAMVAYLATGLDGGLVGLGTRVAFHLPGSRAQEVEADYLGLIMMARSGYNPSAALDVWSRMERLNEDESPQYLSTHPSHHNRFGKTKSWLPEADKKRHPKP